MSLPQRDLQLLDGDVARRLLAWPVPARVAYTALQGTPRIVPTWFQWTDTPTFLAAPHVQRPPGRIRGLRAHPDVAVSVDTDDLPPEVLLVRGGAEITEVDGVDPDYAVARRYMGEEAAEGYLQQPADPATRMARITVRQGPRRCHSRTDDVRRRRYVHSHPGVGVPVRNRQHLHVGGRQLHRQPIRQHPRPAQQLRHRRVNGDNEITSVANATGVWVVLYDDECTDYLWTIQRYTSNPNLPDSADNDAECFRGYY